MRHNTYAFLAKLPKVNAETLASPAKIWVPDLRWRGDPKGGEVMGAASAAISRVGQPYKVVGHEKVAPRALNISLSLGYYYRAQKNEHSSQAVEAGGRTGLRRNVAMIRDAIEGLKDAYLAGDRVPPVCVLARRVDRMWRSTMCVIDGAMRVAAAVEAGVPRIEVALVVPEVEDTEPEALFLACNATGSQRLTTVERDAVLRSLAHRYRLEHPDERDPDVFARRLQSRTGLAVRTIANAVRGEFRPRTAEQRQLAEHLLREGKPVSEVARLTGVSRQAVQKQKDRLEGKQRSYGGSQRREPDPIVTGADIVIASLPRVDAPATAAALRLALKKVRPDLDKLTVQLKTWGVQEARECTAEQAKIIWSEIDALWEACLQFNIASRIYRDPYLARRDLARLQEAVALASHGATQGGAAKNGDGHGPGPERTP
jgi:hypothetical protein